MKCVYRYNDNVYNSYQELIKEFSEENIEQALAIIFSLDSDPQQQIADKITKINQDFKFKKQESNTSSVNVDLDPDISVDSNYYTTQTFIDSGYFNVNGEAPIFRLNMQEYIDTIKDRLINKDNMSELDSAKYCENIKNNWDKIASDSSDLHRIIVSSKGNQDLRHFSGATLNTSFSKIYDKLPEIVQSVEKSVLKRNGKAILFKNLNVEAELRNLAEHIMGHIDYLCVKPNGTIEIFNLKTSTENYLNWGTVKTEKFKYQLALLKRILEYNGIDARNIRVNLIPVRIKYNEDFNEVTDISVSDAITIDQQKDFLYTFQKYDNVAAQFIDSNASIEDLNDDSMLKVTEQLNNIFPGRDVNIRYNGIKESAKGWVRHNWKQIAKQSNKKGWDIKLPNEKKLIHIDDTRIGDNNQELINIIKDREEELFDNTASEKGVNRIIQDVHQSFENQLPFFGSSTKGSSNTLLAAQLNKYFDYNGSLNENNKVVDYKWELVNNQELLNNSGILMFRHKITNQIDVITLTPYDVSTKNTVKGRDHILGYHMGNLNDYNFTMESNYGNIEAVRTLTLLNEILPKLNFKPKLGQLKIVGLSNLHKKKGAEFEFSHLLQQFDTIVEVTNSSNSALNMVNNFKNNNVEVVDAADVFIQTWKEIISEKENVSFQNIKDLNDFIEKKINNDGTVIDGLESVETTEGKIEKLEIIIDKLHQMASEYSMSTNPQKLLEYCHNSNPRIVAIAKLYCSALRALSIYNGDLTITNEEYSQMQEYLVKPQSISNSNIRTVGYMFQKSINKIANQMVQRYSNIQPIIKQFYKDSGYSSLENSLIGDQVRVFKNLYELDESGEKTMRFKNPYIYEGDSTYLKDYERSFLKNILFELNKIRYEMKGLSWDYISVNDSKLIESINEDNNNYLDVPLERASTATRRTNMKQGFKEFADRWMKRLKHPKEAFDEFTNDILNDEEKKLRDSDIANLQAYNPFQRSENTNRRSNYIISKGVNYFETNVENIMIDFLEKHLQSVEYNKMLTRTKGILLDIYLKGLADGDEKNMEHTVKTIEDYLSVNVFNTSIMEESSQKIEAFLEPIRKAVSKCYIAANPAGAMRDTIEGLLQNITKSIIKFQTDINPKDVLFGYKEVISEGPGNLMTISKLNQLNVKYRFSNLDVARISEGQKTGRGGILNAENWAYSTLRGPDYLNRMVLFSAKMHHDGCYDAYIIKDGKLKYDWRLDKRFKEYAANNTESPEYNKHRSLYLSLLREFNIENGTKLVEGQDDLPDAYTLAQIESFKTFADNIYGSYNKSTRAKYENTAIGRNFAVFSTWMNGIVDVYAKKRQISKGESKWVQMKDPSGELLYFDKYGNTKTIAEGGNPEVPVMEDIPVMVQGIWYTLVDAFKEYKYNGWGSFKSNIWNNEINRRNLKRLLSDLLVAGILGIMFKAFIDPEYKDHKTNASGNDVATNAIIELLYKSSSNAFDGFRGPFAILDYIGNSTNPATYKLQSKVLNDTYQFIFGDKTIGQLTMGSQALPRSFKDTYEMWLRDQAE